MLASDVLYYTFAPTLRYSLNFPRSGPVRVKRVLRHFGEFVRSHCTFLFAPTCVAVCV